MKRTIDLTDDQETILARIVEHTNTAQGTEFDADSYLAHLVGIDLGHAKNNLPDPEAEQVKEAFKNADEEKRAQIKEDLGVVSDAAVVAEEGGGK
jgi:hypothetical protein